MTSFRKAISLCCACFILAVTACILAQLTWRAGASVPAGTTTTLLGSSAHTWVWVPVIGGTLVLAVSLSFVLRLRMRGDLARLRTAIRQLATPEKDIRPRTFAIEELCDCAADLADVAERLRQEQARLSENASRDPLTGLSNRRPFIDTLARETAFARRTDWPLSLVMVDLDHFKALNDRYGHHAGDVALRRTADRLASLVRQSDIVARLGGEEFGIILPGTGLRQATRIAQQLRDALRCDQFIFEQNTIQVTASFGVAELHECRAADADSLMSYADTALYQAKRGGRDTVMVAPAAPTQASVPQEAVQPPGGAEDPSLEPQEQEEKEEAIDRDTLALIGSTFSVLQVIPDKHRVAHDTVQQVATVLEAGTVRLFLCGPGDTGLVPAAWVAPAQGVAVSASDDLQAWVAARLYSSQFVPDRCLEPTQTQDHRGDTQVTVVRLPLAAYGEIIGVVQAEDLPADLHLSKRQQTVLSALAAIGATALKNCDTYERLTNRLCGLVEALSKAVHANDAYKRDHCERVSATAVSLAQVMGQHDQEELQLLRIAGLVHDIGNIGLPERLFKKKGRLRDGEWKLVQEHCRIGADIIDGIAEMDRLARIVRHHHEHHDGGGYPDGLAGCAIPIESRIIAMADAYVAMTSPRPHRDQLTHLEAVERIRQAAGQQFDPAIVEAFLEWAQRPAGTADDPAGLSAHVIG